MERAAPTGFDPDPTDKDRYPTLSADGHHLLSRLNQHPHAPLFRNHSGNRLTTQDVARVRAFECEVAEATESHHPHAAPDWLMPFVARCYAEAPYFRARGKAPAALIDVPPTTRADLARDIAQFVPDSAPLERLINFRTSGATGHPLLIASHPVVAASYLAYHKRALRRFGIELRNGTGTVGVALLGFQRNCFTYTSVTPAMNESGFVKLNLHPDDWRDAADRARYLDALEAEVYAGDPLSYAALLELPCRWKPRALLCTAMMLTPALRLQLETRFNCPVVDIYSLNEAGPVAVADARAGGHVLLQHRMQVEILDDSGTALPLGIRGEITLTGGFNFCLPLLRYRTGDYAALELNGSESVLMDLAGRKPLRFRAAGGWLNNIEVTQALRHLPLQHYRLHQHKDGSLCFEYAAEDAPEAAISRALHDLFGHALPLQLSKSIFADGKQPQYSSDMEGAIL